MLGMIAQNPPTQYVRLVQDLSSDKPNENLATVEDSA